MKDNKSAYFYKLIVLYTLSRVKHPLTQSQMNDFILGSGYMDYFQFNETIADLVSAGMLQEESLRNRTFLSLTDEGVETAQFFTGRLDEDTRRSIDEYLTANKHELINQTAVQTNCYKSTTGEYIAELVINEHGSDLINVKLALPTEEIAQSVCDHFLAKNQAVYKLLLDELLK